MARFQNVSKEKKKERFNELMTKPVGQSRRKAIKTIARKRGISFDKAKRFQAKKILGIKDDDELNDLPRPKPPQSSLGQAR